MYELCEGNPPKIIDPPVRLTLPPGVILRTRECMKKMNAMPAALRKGGGNKRYSTHQPRQREGGFGHTGTLRRSRPESLAEFSEENP
jgi:hypothetical protein